MTCETSRDLMEGLLDEELEAGPRSELREHLAECHACLEAFARLQEQRGKIRTGAPRYEAPADLATRVRTAVRREAASEVAATPPTNHRWRWAALAASVLLLASLAWNLLLLRSRSDLLAEEVLSGHVRSLMGSHLLDVVSTDQHTVKPWFNGKLDYAPEVKDLAAQGFPLIGGRIDFLAGRTVAALVYRRRQHTINLFTWPAGTAAGGTPSWSQRGFNLIHWEAQGMAYWAASDVSAADLEEFRRLYQK